MTLQAEQPPGWRRASQAKTAQASARNATLAQEAIALLRGQDVPADWLRVAAVVADGGRTWEAIGAELDMTKFEAASKFRRLLTRAGLR